MPGYKSASFDPDAVATSSDIASSALAAVSGASDAASKASLKAAAASSKIAAQSSAWEAGGDGTTPPGGTDLQMQYNNAGVFDGAAFIYDDDMWSLGGLIQGFRPPNSDSIKVIGIGGANAITSGQGGPVFLGPGNGAGSGSGGDVYIGVGGGLSGNGGVTGNGGGAYMSAGNAGLLDGSGGVIQINSGVSYTGKYGGEVRITGGNTQDYYVTPTHPDHPGYPGLLDDITVSGTFTGTDGDAYEIQICTEGNPDQFKWSKNGGVYSAPIDITASDQYIADGLSITFANLTGHKINVFGAHALGYITVNGTPAENEYFTVDTQVFTFKSSVNYTGATGQVLIDADNFTQQSNIATSINRDLTTVTAINDGAFVFLSYYIMGVIGNSTVFTNNTTNISINPTGGTLYQGVDNVPGNNWMYWAFYGKPGAVVINAGVAAAGIGTTDRTAPIVLNQWFGNVGIQTKDHMTTPPTAKLHIGASLGLDSDAPLKLTPGVLLTNLELGAVEFTDDGTDGHLYITMNVGSVLTRVQIV